MVGEEAKRRLGEDVRRQVRRIREASLRSPLETEIVLCLMDGRRTAAELTETIFGPGGDLKAEYARVRRDLKGLESRGIVAATTLFGRERPYRLTKYGVAKLIDIGGMDAESLFPHHDIALYVATTLLFALVLSFDRMPEWTILLFVFASGASTVRLLEVLRKVS